MIMFPNQPIPSINDEFTREIGFAFSLVLAVESSIKYLYMEDIMKFKLLAEYGIKPTTETLEDVWISAFRRKQEREIVLAKQPLHEFLKEQLSSLKEGDLGSWLALNRISCWRNILAHASVIMGSPVAIHFSKSEYHINRIRKYIDDKESGYGPSTSVHVERFVIGFLNLRCVLRDVYILDKYFLARHSDYLPIDWSEIENAVPRLRSEIGYYDGMIGDWAKDKYIEDGGKIAP